MLGLNKLDLYISLFWLFPITLISWLDVAQYFINPKVPKEPVPSQLELLAKDILVPLQATFHDFVDKVVHYIRYISWLLL